MVIFSVDEDGVSRTMSDAPPTHFIVKIQSFSLLAKNALNKYESGDFEAGGYKWKLVLHPNGNKSKNVEDHISLYLAMVDTNSLGLGWEVYAVLRLFVLNQKLDKFFLVQDAMAKENRFHPFKLEHGFDQFISLETFNNASNGYLVDDTCVLGADVFVKKTTGKGECLSLIKHASSYKHVWKIENFSKIIVDHLDSDVFYAGDHKWKMQLYPKGESCVTGTHISPYLSLADPKTITPGSKIYVNYKLRILDQVHARHKEFNAYNWFSCQISSWGRRRFISLDDFNQPGNGYLVKDVCVVEAEVTVLGSVTSI